MAIVGWGLRVVGGGTGKERRRRDTEGLRVMGNRGRRFGGFVRFAYAEGKGVGWGCQLLDDSL